MVTTPEAPQAVSGQHSELMCTEIKRVGRPIQPETITFGIRLPITVYAVVQRRADRAGMSIGEYIGRVIEHEVVRSHHKRVRT